VPTLLRSVGKLKGPDGVAKKSPGTVNGIPYTNSADEAAKSSFGAVLMPSSTHGSSSTQFGPSSLARSADLSVLWKRSRIPLAWG